MNVMPIQVTQEGVMIPLTYFAESDDLELVVNDGFAIVRMKGVESAFPAHERQADMLQEVAAFEANHSLLLAKHLGEYVAICKGQLVDHDTDHLQLVRRIDANYPDDIVLIRQVQKQLPSLLREPFPRLVPRQ